MTPLRSFLAAFAAVVVLTAWWSYTNYAEGARRQAIERLETAHLSRADALAKWRSERYADAQYYVDNAAVLALTTRLDDPDARAELADLMGRMQSNHGYLRIGLHDATGRERVARPATPEPAPGHMADRVVAVARSGVLELHNVHDDGNGGAPHLALLAPLVSRGGGPGAVLLTMDARASVTPILAGGLQLTPSTRSLVVLREGETIRVINQVVAAGGAHQPADVRLPVTDTHLAVVRAGLGTRGVFEAHDAHGRSVVAVATHLPDTGGALLTMVPTTELFAGIDNRLRYTWIIAGLSLLAGVAVAGFVSQWQQRQLFAVEQRHLSELEAMAQVVSVSPVVLFRWKPQEDMAIEWVSSNVSRWGYDPARLMANDPPGVTLIHEDDRVRVLEEAMRQLTSGAEQYAQEYRVMTPDGGVLWVDDRTMVQRDAWGVPVRLEGILTDITERKMLEAKFVQAQKMEVVGRLAGGIAHDFNNLLTVINGYADFALMELDEDAPLRPMLTEIKQAGTRAAALTGQLLTFSRRQVVQPVSLNLNDIVTDMTTMLQRLIGEDVRLVTELTDEGGGPVLLDRGQLEQVIMNLAVNSRDAMPTGGTLTIRTARTPEGQTCLSVIDTGIGMDAATQARLFEPFFTTKGAGKGTGLGLATVYGIVAQAGGTVHVQSAPGAGATFCVCFPVQAEAAPVVSESMDATPLRGTERVLVVEDEPALRRVAEHILEAAGYETCVAPDGETALALVTSGTFVPQVLLTDVVMPGMNGRDLATALRGRMPELPVVLTSGYLHDVVSDVAELGQGYRFVPKPYTSATLTRAIRDALASV